MKAILLTHLPETETLPARVKVTAHGLKPRTFFVDSDMWNRNPCDPVYVQAIMQFIHDNNVQHWGAPQFGQLPNGSYCATFKAKL
tara:strand:+ start:11673 stop:11927 length:255 start_codon:yes stop_codon:yes gene_type:complete